MRQPHSLRSSTPIQMVLLAALVLCGATSARGQSAGDDSAPSAGGRYVSVGVNFTDLAPLNDRLAAADYPTFSTEMVSVGLGGYRAMAGPLLLGGELQGLFTPSQGRGGREVFVGGGYGLLTLGYLTRLRPSLRLYPQVGVGGGGLLLNIGSAGTDQFDAVLADPGRSAALTKGSVLVRLGAGLEYRFGSPEEQGVRLGLQGGYLISVLDSGWQLDPDALSGGPDASLQGAFLRVTFGGLKTLFRGDE